MKITAQFFYGSCYSAPSGKDIEHFDSIAAAKRTLLNRSDFDPYYPCVTDAAVLIWRGHYEDVTDVYPDYEFTVGKRGGINGGAI